MSEKQLLHHSCFFLIYQSLLSFVQRKCKYNSIFHHWTNEITNKYIWYSCKMFVLYRKWKIKNIVVFSRTPWSLFNQTRHAFFLHVSNVLGICRGIPMRLHTSYAETWKRVTYFDRTNFGEVSNLPNSKTSAWWSVRLLNSVARLKHILQYQVVSSVCSLL